MNNLWSDSDISWGGFSKHNIKKWLIKECLESGDPENFFLCMYEAVEEIKEDFTDESLDWSQLW